MDADKPKMLKMLPFSRANLFLSREGFILKEILKNFMQLIACDGQGIRVIAFEAQKKIDYHCPECGSPLRLRKGPHVQPHFYHYRKSEGCKHHKKTLAHLHNQLYLAEKLPKGEAVLEHPFKAIGRIADVFWPAKRIVFEVQYSAMTAAEAEAREKDYRSLGLDLVWILHEARFNKRRLSSAEHIFTSCTVYYTSIRSRGSGMIYDQFEIIRGGMRCFKGARFPINPAKPYSMQEVKAPSPCPDLFSRRLQTRSLGFTGDIIDMAFKMGASDFSSLIKLEERYSKDDRTSFSWLRNFAGAYRAFLYALLEKTL